MRSRSTAVAPNLYPPLANARTWHNNEDGTIDLADYLGRTIVEFSPGDGLAYISVEPRSVILSMSTEGVSLFLLYIYSAA